MIYFAHRDALRPADALQKPWLHGRNGSVARIRHWRKYSDVQHRARGADSVVAVSQFRPPCVRLVHSSKSAGPKKTPPTSPAFWRCANRLTCSKTLGPLAAWKTPQRLTDGARRSPRTGGRPAIFSGSSVGVRGEAVAGPLVHRCGGRRRSRPASRDQLSVLATPVRGRGRYSGKKYPDGRRTCHHYWCDARRLAIRLSTGRLTGWGR